MLTYWILVVLVLLGYFIHGKRQSNRYFIFILISLVFISTLRGEEVGGDLENYLPLFKEISKSWETALSNDKFGFLFKIFIKLSTLISSNTTWILFATSLVNIGIPLFFIKKHSKSILLSVFIYITMAYYTNTFNSIRSSMSLACGMLVVSYLLRENKRRAFLWALISVEIHKSMFPVFLLFFLIDIKPTFWKLTIPIVTSILVANVLGITPFFSILSYYYTSQYGDALFERMDLTEFVGSGYKLLIMDIIILYICYFLMKNEMTKSDAFFLNMFCLATCLQAVAPLFSLVTRIALFFSVYVTVLLPNALSYVNKRGFSKLSTIALIIICLLYFKITVMTSRDLGWRNSNSQCTIPYYFVWEDMPKL